MQTLTPSLLNAANVAFDTIFQQLFKDTPSIWQNIASRLPSSGPSTVHAWLTALPNMRKWIGDRQILNLATEAQTIVNENFEETVRVKRNDIEDDQLGIYNSLFSELGRAAKRWPDQLVVAALRAGITAIGYDGVPFFSASHPLDHRVAGSAVQTNLHTSMALNATNYSYVRSVMMSLLDINGTPMELMPNLLVVPPQLEGAGKQVLNAEIVGQQVVLTGPTYGAAGVSNVFMNSASLLVLPQLAVDPTTWYLLDTTRGIKPFIFQERKSPRMVYLNAETDANVFFRGDFLYGVDARGAAGYALWQMAARATA